MHGADGGGPVYCETTCGSQVCDDCNRPGILPDNADAVDLFMAAATQWRQGPRGPAGIDYTGLRATADWLGMTPTPDLLDQVRVMEGHTLKLMRENHGD